MHPFEICKSFPCTAAVPNIPVREIERVMENLIQHSPSTLRAPAFWSTCEWAYCPEKQRAHNHFIWSFNEQCRLTFLSHFHTNFTSRLPLFHICGRILALGLGLGLRSGATCVTHRHTEFFLVKGKKEDDGGSATMASTITYTVMEGFTHIYAKLSVYLHPSRAANVQQGVREIMNSLLLR